MILKGDESLVVPFFVPFNILSKVQGERTIKIKSILPFNIWICTELNILHIYNMYDNQISKSVKGMRKTLNFLKSKSEYSTKSNCKEINILYKRSNNLCEKINKSRDEMPVNCRLVSLKYIKDNLYLRNDTLAGNELFVKCIGIYILNNICSSNFDLTTSKDQIIDLLFFKFKEGLSWSKKTRSLYKYFINELHSRERAEELFNSFNNDIIVNCVKYNRQSVCTGQGLSSCSCLSNKKETIRKILSEILWELSICFTIFIP